GPDDPAHVEAVLAALEPGERITDILVTHTHTDHSAAVPALVERTGAPTWGFGPHGFVAPDDPTDRVVFGDPDADKEPPPDAPKEGADIHFSPDHALRHGDEIGGPGWTITALHTPGHTSNHMCFALAEDGALFCGDHVMGWSTSVIGPPDGDLGDYLASLRLLMERDDAVYFPTHGPPITDPKPFVQAYLDHRAERERQVLDALGAGHTTLVTMVPVIYADVHKILWRAAAMSTFSCLLKLVAEGRVRTDGEPRRTGTYRLV
ncbi:MAG TPA: MBL fold metallo-hydrolase, partial [Acidimicrobiales bacterium]